MMKTVVTTFYLEMTDPKELRPHRASAMRRDDQEIIQAKILQRRALSKSR